MNGSNKAVGLGYTEKQVENQIKATLLSIVQNKYPAFWFQLLEDATPNLESWANDLGEGSYIDHLHDNTESDPDLGVSVNTSLEDVETLISGRESLKSFINSKLEAMKEK